MLSSRSESSQYKWTTAHQQPHQRLRPQHRVRQQHQQTPQQVPILKRPKWITSSARTSFRASSTARREQISGNGQKIQLCIYQHHVLMHAKSFWSGWPWRRSTWRKQQFEPNAKKRTGNSTASAHSAESPFVYLSMRTTGTARKIVTSGKRGDGLNAWRRLFQEYNVQLVTGAQALLRRALSMGRAKSVADVSDRIQELEELVRKYEKHEGCTFPATFKIQKLMDIFPEDAERQLTLESTNTKPNFESLKRKVSQWVLLNHRGKSAMDCSHVGNGGGPDYRNAQTSEHGDNSTWSSRCSEGHDWSGQEEEESQEGYIENQNSYLGYNGMGHHDNEGISGITKGKGKGKKGSGKGVGKQFQGCCNTCGMWGHKAIDCKSQGKGKDSTRWYHGNRGKDRAKVEQRDLPKARAREWTTVNRASDVGWWHHLSTTCCCLSERRNQPTTYRRRNNTVTSTRAQRQEQPVTRINSGKCQSNRSKFIPRMTRKKCKCEIDLKYWEQTTKNPPSSISTMIQAWQKRLQRHNTKAGCKTKHLNIDQWQRDSMHVVKEKRPTCALLREERCFGVQKKERSGGWCHDLWSSTPEQPKPSCQQIGSQGTSWKRQKSPEEDKSTCVQEEEKFPTMAEEHWHCQLWTGPPFETWRSRWRTSRKPLDPSQR